MIRFFYPKGFDFRTVTEADIASVEALLNHRPRKCLDWKTPFEVFWEKVLHLIDNLPWFGEAKPGGFRGWQVST